MASKMCAGAFAAAASLSLFGCGSSDDKSSTTTETPTSDETIAQLVVGDKDLSVLKTALVAAHLVDTFNKTDGDKYTVFAPTNDAFYPTLNGTVNCLLYLPSEAKSLVDLLEYHVVKTAIESSDLKNESVPTLLEGEDLNITVDGDAVMVNDAKVTQADIAASDGEVHIVNHVLIPQHLDTLSCPTESIAGTASSVPMLKTLVAALQKADLVDMFSTVNLGEVYTVFAPTDDAFAEVQTVVDCLLKDENKAKLVEILEYHVVGSSYVFASQLKDGEEISTLLDQTVKVTENATGVFINDAAVAQADVTTTNGIVHVIDKVLVPANFSCGESSTVMV